MRRSYFRLLEGVLFSLPLLFASCGNGDNALEEIINGGGSGGGSTAVTEITIDLASLDAKYLNDEKTQLNLKVGDEVTLSFTIKPDELADTEVTLTPDDPTIVSIDGKKVKALLAGTTKVTAKAGDKTATCEVTVLPTLSTPLTIEAITAGTIKVAGPQAGMQYSLNGGAKQAVTTDAITVAVGGKVAFYGQGISITQYAGTQIGGTAQVKVYGNIMSLVDEENFATNYNTLPANSTFENLFKGNEKLTDASGLLLPAPMLTNNCYDGMFQGCTSLAAAPKELPATELTDNCYEYMFSDCKALTTAPKLPATTLASNCYAYMFFGCSQLTETPKLPATSASASVCYDGMFKNCTSLTTAYVKAAKNLNCNDMFNGCTADGAVLHTTTASETSWNTNKPGTNWTINPDWND
jgi:hypothetical protein